MPALDTPPTPGAQPPARRKPVGGGLGRYLLIRFLLIIPTIFILVTLVFILMRSTGDPITASVGGRLPADQLAERIHEAGYDRPVLVQYVEFLGQVATGNFGRTLTDNRAVSEVLLTYGTASFELAVYSLLVAFVIGIPLGLLAGYIRDKWGDAAVRVFAILCYATPVFFAGLLLKLIFSVWLGWLPVYGRASVSSELQMQLLPNPTGLYTIDAIRTGDPAVPPGAPPHPLLPAGGPGLLPGGGLLAPPPP